ncbi:RsmB/NOP family class I SAM-dependent RNA methyltransferase [candidate division WOR-3 bacterium]|nr:RsmB/NOP family class I SAM-dependent RNA methyltransferase [candidate division WOR-3 bacterium]
MTRRAAEFPGRFLDRCRAMVPDFEPFIDSMSRPPRRTVRVNTIKANREQVLGWLRNLDPQPLDWWENALALGQPGVGKRLEHFLGLVYVQEAASMVPPLVLGAEPGETVLDLCAAPGSKTTQLAAMMENTGLVVANDYSQARLRGLVGNVDRAGCLNVVITRMDGVALVRNWPGSCDRVLVDAPCTCEGTVRRSARVLDQWSLDAIARFSQLQKGLAVAGYHALKPGGTMVYSTCTLAPEENEEVVDYLARRFPEAELLPVELPGFRMRQPLAEWNGRRFATGVANCRRILPQDNDTEAFFLALIRRPIEAR